MLVGQVLQCTAVLQVLEAIVQSFDCHGEGRIAQHQDPDPVGGKERPIVHQGRGRAQDGQRQGRRLVHCLQLLAGPQAHQPDGLHARLGVGSHPVQGLVQGQ